MDILTYPQARNQFADGDLIALSHYNWASFYDLQVQAVRFFTQSEYAHVGIILNFGGRVWVVESVTPKIRLVPLSYFAKEGFYHVQLNKPMSNPELEFMLSKVGKGEYSKWQAIMAQLSRLHIGADDMWECAEFVIASRALSGVDLGTKATPSGVVQYALENGASLRLIKANVYA